MVSETTADLRRNAQSIDDQLSHRPLDLDPAGYFIIYLDRPAGRICAQHFTNTIDERGLALDPETGEPIPARGKVSRTPTQVFTGRTAKEICVHLFEHTEPIPVSQFSHAAYLGRELMRAEQALLSNSDYVQD
ncbi:MAG: DUF4346 domain-containing protein [Gloeomargaritaceae cyanobacterium C42_A2020_066]|nr:DUF4346 domain-containing protein [Gloeomargaritaceae cyanobacterium C42_A2020_066]